ncbi:phosphatidylglycerol:prolipoprotein diacylglycerol transferase [Lachnospiraceae bacterium]|nr:phosphatidylglycerol:prolipoprotein diacylglycerol transferase [Lachnospiraceae bacterium]
MNVTDIEFPNLHLYLKDVPKSFSVFGFSVALYGCVIGLGMLLCVLIAGYDRKSRGLDEEIIWDAALYGIVFGIIGARAYYVIFQWDYYKNDLLSIFNLRQGGLGIYGGIIAGFLTAFVYCRIKKKSFLELSDSVALVFPLGQAMGRWGNFFNREVFGGWSDGLFAMRLPISAVRESDISQGIAEHITEGMTYIQVHPTFLYESVWNIILFVCLFLYRKKKKFKGEIFCLYLFFYGMGRFWIEGIRTDQLIAPVVGLPISQIVAAVCMIVSGAIMLRHRLVKNI